jgi:sarcosine oxidase delta subunit
VTIFGPDISSYEHGVNVTDLTDPFVMLKCTEGTYYADADYSRWLAQAKASSKLAIAYHFVRDDESAVAQAQWMKQHILDASLPVMLDVETEGSSKPTAQFIAELADAMSQLGLRVKLAYLPRWYWEQVGSPDLTPLANRGIGLVSSAYPARGGQSPSVGYADSGGDGGTGWGPYGGVRPVLWQFTDSGLEQQKMDFNAFRGTITELAALLKSSGGQGTGGGAMGNYTVTDGWQRDYPDVASQLQKHIPAGLTVDETEAAAYAMIRAFVAAERSAVIEQKLDQLLAAKPPVVDIVALENAIMAAIDQHLTGGVDAHAIAVAVQTQLAAALGTHGVG